MQTAQNSVDIRDLGAATGGATFVRTLGGSLGVAILGAVYASHLASALARAGGPASAGGHLHTLTPTGLRRLPEAFQLLFGHAVVNGTHAIFLVAAAIGLVGLVASWAIQHVPLRGNEPSPAASAGDTLPVPLPSEMDAPAR